MADNAERRVVIDWFKNDFSREAMSTTRTAKMPDGTLAYNFSVTNNSGIDFDYFKFRVKVIDKESGRDLGTALINAGKWAYGSKKNFKSRFAIPDDVRNISFVMFAETIDYQGRTNVNAVGAESDMGGAIGRGGEGIGGVFGELFGVGGMPGADQRTPARPSAAEQNVQRGPSQNNAQTRTASTQQRSVNPVGSATQSFTQKKNEKKLNKMRLGKSGWIIATLVMGLIFVVGAIGSITSGDNAGAIEAAAIAAICFAGSGYIKYSLGKKAKRIRTYETRVNTKGNTSLDELAASVGRPYEKVADELHQMIVDGFFPGAYVDMENRLLVMTENGKPIEDVARSVAQNRKAKRKAAREDGVVPESLDDLITMTDDSEIKSKLKSLRTITKKIDARVEQVPELEKQVKDFRENFYPEVVRLTDEYNEKIVDMGRYGEENVKPEVTESADGSPVLNTNPNYLQEQANEIKNQLISLIDSVTEASENLLEKLHEDDIMDITTDIKMLETTLASKGLLDSDFDVK